MFSLMFNPRRHEATWRDALSKNGEGAQEPFQICSPYLGDRLVDDLEAGGDKRLAGNDGSERGENEHRPERPVGQ